MKWEKFIFSIAFLILIFSAPIYFNSCGKKYRCVTEPCQNGGVCVDGNCTCLYGYYGTKCEMLKISNYTGDYVGKFIGSNVSGACFPIVDTPVIISVYIPASPILALNQVMTGNLIQFSCSSHLPFSHGFSTYVDFDKDSLTIDFVNLGTTSNQILVSGNGKFSHNKDSIWLNYVINTPQNPNGSFSVIYSGRRM